MRKYVVHVCSFTSLDDLTRKQHRDAEAVLRAVMAAGGRFSVYDATSTPEMARTMSRLERTWLRRTEKQPAYPWIQVELTEEGRKVLEAAA